MKRVALLALFLCWGIAPVGAAQTGQPGVHQAVTDEFSAQRRLRPIATRLEIFPSSRQVRRCVDWYQIEYRPSGKVLTPQMRCWWARR
jgi:hypothetical protein